MTKVKNTYEAATEKQKKFAEFLAKKKGFRFLSESEKACFGKTKIGGLKRGDMSILIDFLKK